MKATRSRKRLREPAQSIPHRVIHDIGPPTALSRPQRPDSPPITLTMIWSLDSTLISRALAKERLDLILKGVFVHHACVRLGNLPVAVNEQSHRERGESPVSGALGLGWRSRLDNSACALREMTSLISRNKRLRSDVAVHPIISKNIFLALRLVCNRYASDSWQTCYESFLA